MARKEGLLGRKAGLTQVFGEDGSHLPVTVIQAGPCTVTAVRSKATDGYDALQLGFETKKKNVTKPMQGHFKKGGVKRHNWKGGEASHGSMFQRAPGSIGASSDPSRVWPGHKLPGRMGGDRRTVLNLPVVRVIPEQNLILLRGAVPGHTGTLLVVRKSVKQTKSQQQKAKEVK